MSSTIKDLAVVFDLDGVISDTQDLHAKVDSSVLKHFGLDLHPAAITDRFAGAGDQKMFSTLFHDNGINAPVQDAIDLKWTMMANSLTGSNLNAVPHAINLIRQLSEAGVRMSIGSGSPKHFIRKVLDSLALHNYFECYVSSEDVLNAKPHPDVFLLAASRMGVNPAQCVVIEDGVSGMKAAAAAGMTCIGLVRNALNQYPATAIVTSLNQVTLELLCHLRDIQNSYGEYANSGHSYSEQAACSI